jgi:hypothetical protein
LAFNLKPGFSPRLFDKNDKITYKKPGFFVYHFTP